MNYQFLNLFFLFLTAYLIGSIPFALVIAAFKKVDLRSNGSGNIGATNVFRVIGKPYGILVFFLDGAKGFLMVELALRLFEQPFIHVLVGCTVIAGHTLTCFARFKGGKGAATALGVIFSLSPDVFFILFVLGLLIIYFIRIVSLSTIICSVLVPLLLYAFGYPKEYYLVLGAVSVYIIFLHRGNIQRLWKGEENRI